MNITRFLIDNPLIKWVSVIIIFLVFLFSIQKIKRYAFPRVDLNEVTIVSVVGGFSAVEMESEVTDLIEEKLENISGIKKFTSKSSQNLSFIHIQIDSAANTKEVKDDIREEVDSIGDFPTEMESRPVIEEIKIDRKPMIVLGVTSKSNRMDWAHKHAHKIMEILKKSPFISEVVESIPDEEVKILLNLEKMNQLGITVEEVVYSLQNNQKRLSAGSVESSGKVKQLITYARADSLEEIENLIIRASGTLNQGIRIRIKDIAVVENGFQKQNRLLRFNGNGGFQLSLIRRSDADIIEAAHEVNLILSQYRSDANDQDLEIVIHEDDSQETDERLTIAFDNAIMGLILVCVSLFLFLNRSIAFWSCLSIPTTMFASITLMWFFNVSINTVSLCGIIIMMGIVVDNPTIIGESAYHYRQSNHSRIDSSLITLQMMFKPLIFAGLTTLVSFASMFFIPGMLGDFASEIPLVVIFMLMASFFESVVILPAHLAHTEMSKSNPLGERVILSLKKWYETSLYFTLNNNLKMIAIIFVLLTAGIGFSIFNLKFQLFPFDQAYRVNFTGNTDINSNLRFTQENARIIEEVLTEFPEEGIISSYRTSVGGGSDNEFEVQVRLISYFDRTSTVEEFKDFVMKRVSEIRKQDNSPLQLESFDYFIDGGGPPAGRPIEANIYAHDIAQREEIIEKVITEMEELGYFSEIIQSLKIGKEEVQIRPREEVFFSGITLKKISEILRIAYEGVPVGQYNKDGKIVKWLLNFDNDSKDFFDPLTKIQLLNIRNEAVPLANLLTISNKLAISFIEHEGGDRKSMISANFDKEKISASQVYSLLKNKYENIQDEFPGARISIGGEAKESADTFNDFLFAIIGSILIIYLLLVVQFNNFLQPFMVITSIPFGIVGIVIIFTIHGYSLSFLGMVGVLGFGGVVINASLIMVDYINKIKHGEVEVEADRMTPEQFPSYNAFLIKVIIKGASQRFRPIVITTLTTTIGLIPTSYGVFGNTDVIIAPMTLTMLWGLVVGTIAGLYIIPMLYLGEQRFSSWVNKKSSKKRKLSLENLS